MKILVCNSGSSSLKFGLFEAAQEQLILGGAIDWATRPARLILHRPSRHDTREDVQLGDHGEGMARILSSLQSGPEPALKRHDEITAVGHRIVHGGMRFAAAV